MVEDRRRRRAVLLSTLLPGDAIGEMSLIDGQPHSATVRAETPCEVWLLERAALEACLSRSNAMIYALMCTLVRRLRHAYAHIALLATLDVAGRLACTLLERGEAGEDGRLRLDGRISRTELALRVGATRERVSRVLAEFERRGHVIPHPDGGWWIEASLREVATQPPTRQRDEAFGEDLGDTELGDLGDEAPDTGLGTEPGRLPGL
jgi:CRP-like cAMP-binding protein